MCLDKNPKGQLDLSARFLPRTQAERQIRGLNLFPKHAINRPAFDEDELSGSSSPRIAEKQFQFHLLGNPGPSVKEFGHYAGYYRLSHTKAASELALFYENGPFNIANNLSLSWNDYGWDKASNIIFVDQPTGTGFSYTTEETDIRHDETGVSNDLYDFLQAFFKEHPQLAKNEFYITGESYAGHYIPAFASRVHQGNKKKEGIHINLKGFAIGNGLTQPEIQYKAYTDYALDNKLIEKNDYDSINEMIPDCERAIKSCGNDGVSTCEDAFGVCNNIFQSILQIAGDINYYDIRKTCEGSLCYDFSKMETFLNQKTGIPALLEDGIKVLIYAGEEDLICNWLGNSRWVNQLAWSGQKDFGAAPTVPFIVEGREAGQLKSHGPLSFLKVHNAGHMVPMDQPKAALEMLKSWMQGKLAATGTRDWISPQ
ncbi:hypothetical protein OIU77_020548 [Salix suchowensis]|uniref:Carboxypeptidase n=1 Tax=Salix suchowensis TaxID=1278906 RepID=A0ABQ9CA61_9ROSI|nr:hypothetical protein OIU77_020548 [Salix suchowensis]